MNEEQLKAALDARFKDTEAKLQKMQESNTAKEEEILKLHKSLEDQGTFIENLEKQLKEKKIESALKQFEGFLVENADKLIELKETGHGVIKFVPKADMSTGSGGNAAGVTAPTNMNTNLGNFDLRNDNGLLSLCTVTSTDSPNYPYTDLIPGNGDYEFVFKKYRNTTYKSFTLRKNAESCYLKTGYFIGVDWIQKEKCALYVAPKLNKDSKETDYIKMLFDCMRHEEVAKHLNGLYQIKWKESPIEITQQQDLLTPFLLRSSTILPSFQPL